MFSVTVTLHTLCEVCRGPAFLSGRVKNNVVFLCLCCPVLNFRPWPLSLSIFVQHAVNTVVVSVPCLISTQPVFVSPAQAPGL